MNKQYMSKGTETQTWKELLEYIIENSWFHFDIYCLFITMAICVSNIRDYVDGEFVLFIQKYLSLPFFAREKPFQIINKTEIMMEKYF